MRSDMTTNNNQNNKSNTKIYRSEPGYQIHPIGDMVAHTKNALNP